MKIYKIPYWKYTTIEPIHPLFEVDMVDVDERAYGELKVAELEFESVQQDLKDNYELYKVKKACKERI